LGKGCSDRIGHRPVVMPCDLPAEPILPFAPESCIPLESRPRSLGGPCERLPDLLVRIVGKAA
jgi:hypothetical protein